MVIQSSSFTLSVIIPTFRRFEQMLDTLKAVLDQNYPFFEVIVVDQNESWPVNLEIRLERLKADRRVHWLKLSSPHVVKARNDGVAQSTGEILVFIDDDVLIEDQEFLKKHAAAYNDPAVDAVAGREISLVDYDKERSDHSPLYNREDKHIKQTEWSSLPFLVQALDFPRNSLVRKFVCTFSTCNGSIRRESFLSVGGFDESFSGVAYGDDADLALRLNVIGKKIIFDPESSLVHLRVPLGGLRLSDLTNPFKQRDRVLSILLFIFKYWDRRAWKLLLYNHFLRKTVFQRHNIIYPWRQFGVWFGIVVSLPEVLRRLRLGHQSRFIAGDECSDTQRFQNLKK